MKKVMIAITMVMVSMSVMAEGKMYGGAQYAMATYDESGTTIINNELATYNTNADPTALVFLIGNKFNQNFAVEGRLGMGLGNGNVSGTAVDTLGNVYNLNGAITVKIENFFSVFAKGIAPVGNNVDLYGLIGYTNGKITANAGSINASATASGLSYGFGAEFFTDRPVTMNIEYVNYIDKSNGKLSALSVGANFKF